MRALRLDPDLALRDVPVPEPRAGEALVRVALAGICNTDIELCRGYMDFRGTLGHELVGEVVACDDPAWIGRRVGAEINLGCGACVECARGLARHCPGRTVLGIAGKDGCFADWVTLPIENLVSIPDGLPDEVAVFLEPLAAAFEILAQIAVEPSDRVLVIGDGKLGLLVCAALRTADCELHVWGKHADKLAHARAMGVHTVLSPDAPVGRFDVVVEASGAPDGLRAAIAHTRPRGTLVLKSTFHGATQVDMAPIVIHEMSIVGSRCGLPGPALAALAKGAIDPRPLVSARYALADAHTALERAAAPGTLKVLLSPV
jgi:threonine dehydrogenase-like Zn-dependent dehydrogenase